MFLHDPSTVPSGSSAPGGATAGSRSPNDAGWLPGLASGDLSAWLVDRLRDVTDAPAPRWRGDDPLADLDLNRAVALACELSYDGLPGVDDRWETDPAVVGALNSWSSLLLGRLREAVDGQTGEGEELGDWLVGLAGGNGPQSPEPSAPPTDSTSAWLLARGELRHVREEAVHRSLYQRHEADPHTFAIPRLRGRAKAALVEIQADEYGEGQLEDMHAELFGQTMVGLGLDPTPRAYLHLLPAETLVTSNLVSLLARERRWRGALVGHLALFEMASVPVMAALSSTYARLGCNAWTRLFLDVHVVADADHQRVALHDLALALVDDEPSLEPDVRFGAAALAHAEGRLTTHTIEAWERGESSLLAPLPVATIEDLPASDTLPAGTDPRRG